MNHTAARWIATCIATNGVEKAKDIVSGELDYDVTPTQWREIASCVVDGRVDLKKLKRLFPVQY